MQVVVSERIERALAPRQEQNSLRKIVNSSLRPIFLGQLKLIALRVERGIEASSAIANLRRVERRLRGAA